jgi:hypothetical protein
VRHSQRKLATILAASTLALAVGCGQGVPSASTSSEEATVKGTVTIRGKAATQGQVSFDPANVKRPGEVARTATIGHDGSYTVKTLVGDNAVRVTFPGMEKDRELGSFEQSFAVKPGENEYKIQLPPPSS